MSTSTNRPKKPIAAEMSSASTDVIGSSMWRSGWRIFFLLRTWWASKSRPGLVKGCTRDLLEWFWAEEMEGLGIHGCLTDAMQDPACEFPRMPLLRLSGKGQRGTCARYPHLSS